MDTEKLSEQIKVLKEHSNVEELAKLADVLVLFVKTQKELIDQQAEIIVNNKKIIEGLKQFNKKNNARNLTRGHFWLC